jgi:hypothetical protein
VVGRIKQLLGTLPGPEKNAMIVRLDSFDHYNVQDQKWNTGSAQASIDLTGTKARTGVGCLIINSGFQGPLANLDNLAQIVMGTALHCNTLGGAFCTLGNAVAPPNFYFTNVQLNVTPTGAISGFRVGGRQSRDCGDVGRWPHHDEHVQLH